MKTSNKYCIQLLNTQIFTTSFFQLDMLFIVHLIRESILFYADCFQSFSELAILTTNLNILLHKIECHFQFTLYLPFKQ